MTALPQDAMADLQQRIAELERQLQTAVDERDAAIDRQTASALVNFRLKNEVRAATERQNASAEVLRAIANTSGDADQSLVRITEITARLFGAPSSTLSIVDGDRWGRTIRVGASSKHIGTEVSEAQRRIGGRNLPGTVVQENRQIHIPDLDHVDASMAEWPGLPPARASGTRVMSGTPLRRDGKAIGVLIVYRDRPVPFTDEELELQQRFADQAVIAIENARLFNETEKALARQTATSDILRVISSSPTDVQPVFDEIVLTAARLLRCDRAFIQRHDGEFFWTVAAAGQDGPLSITLSNKTPINPEANFPSRAIVAKETLHLPDWSAIELPQFERGIRELHGINSAMYMPLLRDGECIGLLALIAKQANLFGESEIALAESFRDQALIAIENTRLFNETQEALERQTATSEILKVIASSPSDVQPVFDVIVERAVRLCGGRMGRVYRYDGGVIQMVAGHGLSAPGLGKVQQVFPRPATDDTIAGQVMLSHRPYFVTDIQHDDSVPPLSRQMIEALGTRSQVTVPMLRAGEAIGAITIGWADPGAFGDQQVRLLQTFADQAVIAIENTRLFTETREALERQTATSDILKVIASSPSDVQPVFEAIVGSAKRLLGGLSAAVFRIIDGTVHVASFTSLNPTADAALNADFPRPVEEFEGFRFAREGKPFVIPDTEERTGTLREVARLHGFRSMLYVPLMNGDLPFGIITVTRAEPGPFPPHHIQLLQTFADQAVIAIENTRLFNETREALERQTATADILKVIASSPSDVQPVFDAILARALHLCEAAFGFLTTFDERFAFAAQLGVPPGLAEHFRGGMDQPRPGDAHWRLLEGEDLIHNLDQKDEDAYRSGNPLRRAVVDLGGARSALVVALRKGGALRGSITIYRKEVRPFSASQIELLRHFADQAVIAIENTRLFNEVQERTVELTEALEQQTATAEVLGVISSSAGDLALVFDAMLGKAMQLCSANFGVLNTYDGRAFHTGATYGLPPAYDEYRRSQPLEYGPATAPARLLDGEPFVQLTDLLESEAYRSGEPNRRALVDIGGARCLLAVPLLKDERVVGNVMIFREEDRPFSEKQIALLQQFAAQAVIAIENTRLLRELRESTEDLTESLQQQTATSEVLQIISSSPGDLTPVFDKMLENATRVCGAEFGSMVLVEGDMLRQAAFYNAPAELAAVRTNAVRPLHPLSGIAAAVRDKRVVQTEDIRNSPAYLAGAQHAVELAELGGARTLVVVPMLRDDEAIGVITVYRQEVRPFSEKQVELLTNFARQAVIAIENARLLRELRQRTDDLSKSLDDLRTAQDRLIQTEKLASLGQLTAGIAHEIKNPLNFVNNFAALSAELTDELKDVLKPAVLDETIRAEVDEVTGLLKDNLSKVVQHGKRADSIVKNMLLHSREGSGEHRPADVNALVDESLNLAYHGARAERPQFNVTLQRDFDPQAGQVEVFPQEITRVLLNLISNGFYAVTRRKADHGGDFEPLVTATTRGGDDHVEIRIRDNGTGIPPEVKEKMFNPFFTTKPAGEGTGLGLSMSHDIIVKQHGGRIEVETEPGAFTEFRLVLPRASLARSNGNR